MPIFQASMLFLSLAIVSVPGQAQDPAADNRGPAASGGLPAPGEEVAPSGSSARAEGNLPAPLSLYSSDILVDTPYIYPLLRMRLTPEMRQKAP